MTQKRCVGVEGSRAGKAAVAALAMAFLGCSSGGGPVDPGDVRILKVAVGDSRGCLLLSTGQVMCWGNNINGYLGIPDRRILYRPKLLSLSSMIDLSGGFSHTCALRWDGTPYCWGDNLTGALGDGDGGSYDRPIRVYREKGIAHISAGGGNTCDQRANGSIACWGRYIGDGSDDFTAIPTEIHTLPPVQKLAVGSASCVIDNDGQLWCWGYNSHGELANGETFAGLTPEPIAGLPPVVAVSPMATSCALTPEGRVWCWGYNDYGGAGQGGPSNAPALPGEVVGLSDATAIASGTGFACALSNTGEVRCWGDNLSGTLGDGTMKDRYSPVLAQVSGITMIASHDYVTCAVDTADRLFCWGRANDDLLGPNVIWAPDPVEIDWRSGLDGR